MKKVQGCKVQGCKGARCRVQGARCRVHGARCSVQGARCSVQGALVLALACAFGTLVITAQTPRTVVVRAARMLDPVAGRIVASPTIVIVGDRIQSVGGGAVPAGATTMDLGDLTLLPGLVDSHTHNLLEPEDEITPPVFTKSQAYRAIEGVSAARKNLEAGFTTMRDLDSEGAGFADVALRDAINKGVVPGPRLLVATYALTITGGHMNLAGMSPDIALPDPATLTDSRDAMIAEIRREVKYGADWIKLYATGTLRHVNRETLEPLPQVSLDDVKAVVTEAARWRKDVAAHAYGGVGARNAVEGGVRSIEHGWILDDDTLRLMVQKGTFWCPTLSVFRPEADLEKPSDFTRRVVESHKRTFQAAMKAGVKIVFGTDVGAFPHGTNNREFTYMVEYGMTPLEAIRSATTRAAELLRMEKDIGVIAPGHYADIIAVQGDPLQNIEAIKNVRFVMKGGEVFRTAAAGGAGTTSRSDR
jgi:imidazolonepropionase-like amidohydrolase